MIYSGCRTSFIARPTTDFCDECHHALIAHKLGDQPHHTGPVCALCECLELVRQAIPDACVISRHEMRNAHQ